MKTLSDLTLKQLTVIFGTVAQVATSPKTFNSRAKALSRLEALLAEMNLTIAEARRAAGIEDEAETTAPEPATAPTGAEDPAGTNDAPPTPEANDAAPVASPEAETAQMEEVPDAATILRRPPPITASFLLPRRDNVIPLRVEFVPLNVEGRHLGVRNFSALLVHPRIQPRSHSKPSLCSGCRD